MSDNFHTHPKPGTFTHYPTDFERLEAAEAHIKRLTAENQYQANLLGNAYGAIADWTDLPSDTRPAKAIEHLGREVERLTALVKQDTIDYDELDTELCDSRHTVKALAAQVIQLLAITELAGMTAISDDDGNDW